MSHATDTQRFDCSATGHERCIALGQTFDCGLPATERRFPVASRADLEAAIVGIKTEHPKFEDMALCAVMGVCPNGLFDDFTLEAFRLYGAIKSGDPWPWPGSFYDQPCVFAQARAILAAEDAAVMQEERIADGNH
jgi:hypothetical protein